MTCWSYPLTFSCLEADLAPTEDSRPSLLLDLGMVEPVTVEILLFGLVLTCTSFWSTLNPLMVSFGLVILIETYPVFKIFLVSAFCCFRVFGMIALPVLLASWMRGVFCFGILGTLTPLFLSTPLIMAESYTCWNWAFYLPVTPLIL